MKHKKCKGPCKKRKKIKYFNTRKDTKNGYYNICKLCQSKQKKQYRAENGNEIRKRERLYYMAHRKEKQKYNTKYYAKNIKKFKKYRKKYYKENKIKLIKYQKEYRIKNKKILNIKDKIRYNKRKNKMKKYKKNRRKLYPETVRAIERQSRRKRRALKRKVKEHYTAQDEAITLKIFGCKCFVCGARKHLSIDHYHALSNLNPLTVDNAVPLCVSCNSKKYKKKPEEFYTVRQIKMIKRKFKKALKLKKKSGIIKRKLRSY